MLRVIITVGTVFSVTFAQDPHSIFGGIQFPGSQAYSPRANANSNPYSSSQPGNPFGIHNPSLPRSNVFSQRDPFGDSRPRTNTRVSFTSGRGSEQPRDPRRNPAVHSNIFNFATSPFHSDQPSFGFNNNGGFPQHQQGQQGNRGNNPNGNLADNIIGNIKPIDPGSNNGGFGNILAPININPPIASPQNNHFDPLNPNTNSHQPGRPNDQYDHNRDQPYNSGRQSNPGSQPNPGNRGPGSSNGHYPGQSNNPPAPSIPNFGVPFDSPTPVNPSRNEQQGGQSPGSYQQREERYDPRDRDTSAGDPSDPASQYIDQQQGNPNANSRQNQGYPNSAQYPAEGYSDTLPPQGSRTQPGRVPVDSESDGRNDVDGERGEPRREYPIRPRTSDNREPSGDYPETNQETLSNNGRTRRYPDESYPQVQMDNSQNYPDSSSSDVGPNTDPNASQRGSSSGPPYEGNHPQGPEVDIYQGPRDVGQDPLVSGGASDRGANTGSGSSTIDAPGYQGPIAVVVPERNIPVGTNSNIPVNGDATGGSNSYPDQNGISDTFPPTQGNQVETVVGSLDNGQVPDRVTEGTNPTNQVQEIVQDYTTANTADSQNAPDLRPDVTGEPLTDDPDETQSSITSNANVPVAVDPVRVNHASGSAPGSNPTYHNLSEAPVNSVSAQESTEPSSKDIQNPPVVITSLPGLNPMDFIPVGLVGKSKCYTYKDLAEDYSPSTDTFEYPEAEVAAELTARPFLAPILGYLNFAQPSATSNANNGILHEHLYSENVYPTGYRDGAFDVAVPKDYSCRAIQHALRMFHLYNGRCWTVNPDYQKVSFSRCSAPGGKCGQCSSGKSTGISRCSENYDWVKVWAYCEKAQEEQKIRHIRIHLPTGCSCNAYYC